MTTVPRREGDRARRARPQ